MKNTLITTATILALLTPLTSCLVDPLSLAARAPDADHPDSVRPLAPDTSTPDTGRPDATAADSGRAEASRDLTTDAKTPLGGKCNSTSQCAEGTCDIIVTNTCKGSITRGGTCTTTIQCVDGNYCDQTCKTKIDYMLPCASDEQCIGNYCTAGECGWKRD